MNKNVSSNETKKSIYIHVYSNLKTAAYVGCSIWLMLMHPVSHNPSKCKQLTKPVILESHKSSQFFNSSNGVLNTCWRTVVVRAACLTNDFVTLKNDHNNLFIAGLLKFLNTCTTLKFICRQKFVQIVQMGSGKGRSISLQSDTWALGKVDFRAYQHSSWQILERYTWPNSFWFSLENSRSTYPGILWPVSICRVRVLSAMPGPTLPDQQFPWWKWATLCILAMCHLNI